MGRYRFVDGVRAEFTAEEEIARDAEEATWVAGAVDRAWATLREKRNAHLTETDWTQVPDAPSAGKTAWATYRQALRDLPANTSDPVNPTWPTKPE
jgi:hypothetical protein